MFLKAYVWGKNLFVRDEGATAVEYGIMVAGIAVVIILLVFAVGDELVALFQTVIDNLGPRTPVAPT
jgi:pilus assembly protein Flp/PilA